jgi:hypothetical protein
VRAVEPLAQTGLPAVLGVVAVVLVGAALLLRRFRGGGSDPGT